MGVVPSHHLSEGQAHPQLVQGVYDEQQLPTLALEEKRWTTDILSRSNLSGSTLHRTSPWRSIPTREFHHPRGTKWSHIALFHPPWPRSSYCRRSMLSLGEFPKLVERCSEIYHHPAISHFLPLTLSIQQIRPMCRCVCDDHLLPWPLFVSGKQLHSK